MRSSQKVTSILLLLFISFSLLSLPTLPNKIVQAQEQASIETGWIDEFTYREQTSNDSFMEHFYLDPQVFWDPDSSSWLNFSVTDNRDQPNPHFLVINSRLKVRIGISNDWDLEGVLFYAPNGTEPVCAEVWEIQVFYQGSWQTLTREYWSYEVDYSSSHFNITGIFRMTSQLGTVGWMSLNFYLEPAGFLKHTFGFRRVIAGAALEFRAVMTLLGIPSDLVEGQDEIVVLKPQAVEKIWNRLIFRDRQNAWLQQLEVRLDDLGHFEFNETTGQVEWINDWIRAIRLSTFMYKGRELGRADVVIGNLLMSQGQEVFIDPTLTTFTINNNGYDGYCWCQDAVYANARDGSGVQNVGSGAWYDPYGQDLLAAKYTVYRTFVKWNTGSLDDTAIIDNASVRHYVPYDFSVTDFNISITLWTGSHTFYVGMFTDCEDGYLDDQQTDTTGGTGWSEQKLINYSVISLTTFTNLVIRSNRDIDAITPTGDERQYMEDWTKTSTNHAQLKIWWHLPPVPQPDLWSVDTHQANTEANFVCNWTADADTPPSTSLSHWLFGWNGTVNGDWYNYSISTFEDVTLSTLDYFEVGQSAKMIKYVHPTSETSEINASAHGQSFKNPYNQAINITAIEVEAKRTGSQTGNIQAVIYNSNETVPSDNAIPSGSGLSYSELYSIATINNDWEWITFTFNSSQYYELAALGSFCFAIQLHDVSSEPLHYVSFMSAINDEHEGNGFFYGNLWNPNYLYHEYIDLYHVIHGVYADATTWSNVTLTLPVEVERVVGWQFWANNTDDAWNTTGLQTFITVGINFTFYYTHDGYFSITAISKIEIFIVVTNGSSYGFANGTKMSLFGSPKNSSYYWLNFTSTVGSSTENYANFTALFGLEGFVFWCYFASTPTGNGDYIIARLHWNTTLPDILEPVLFDGSASESSSTITIYEWDYGDGNNATGITAVHSYTAYGNYSVVLNVTSTVGSNSTYQYLTIGSTPDWLVEMNTLPNWEIVILTITSLFFSLLFFGYKIPLWGIIAFGSWLIEGIVWLFINPVSYAVSLLFFGIATVILILTLILQLEAVKLRKRGLGEELMAPV